jgi:hypothetical protein
MLKAGMSLVRFPMSLEFSVGLFIPAALWHQVPEFGRKARKPINKQLLTPAMKQKQFAWANKYRSWTTDDSKKVAFSDEYFLCSRLQSRCQTKQ